MFFGEGHAFKRQSEKLPVELQERVRERLRLLSVDEFHPLLKNHKLRAPFEGYRSINITGDIRLVYRKLDENTLFLRAIGTHHQLYGN